MGFPINEKKAISYLEKASKSGYLNAFSVLGDYYTYIKNQPKQAEEYYQKAQECIKEIPLPDRWKRDSQAIISSIKENYVNQRTFQSNSRTISITDCKFSMYRKDIEGSAKFNLIFELSKSDHLKRIFIQANSTQDNSLYCQYISFKWAKDSLLKEKFVAIFWVPLSKLNEARPNEDLYSFLMRYCCEEKSQDELYPFALREFIKTYQNQILFVVNGIQNTHSESEIVKQLLQFPFWLLTSTSEFTHLAQIVQKPDMILFNEKFEINSSNSYIKQVQLNNKCSGTFDFKRRNSKEKYKLTYFLYQQQHELKPKTILASSLWISDSTAKNFLPAEDLKNLMSHKETLNIPSNGSIEDGEDFHEEDLLLRFNNWDWLSQSKSFEITIIDEKQSYPPLHVIPCLRIEGLKKLIKKELIKDTIDNPWTEYSLYYKGYKLSNKNSLNEYGIQDNIEIQLYIGKKIENPYSTLESWSAEGDFNRCAKALEEKTHIVCRIDNKQKKNSGTGFLVGKRLVITNAHVIPLNANCTDYKVIFHDRNDKKVKFEIDNVVHSSRFPYKDKNWNHIKREALDFTLLSLKVNNWKYKDIYQSAQTAHTFFTYQNRPEWSDARANIIQYPKQKDSNEREKRIAFRENRIHEPEFFLLHYHTQTKNASSGSPVIDDEGNIVGLHTSKCMAIESKLLEKRELLFEKLGLGKYKKQDSIKYSEFEKDENIEFYYRKSNDNCGHFFNKKTGKYSYLLDFIKERTNEEEPLQWALKFLNDANSNISALHVHCKTAVVVDRILEDIEKNRQTIETKYGGKYDEKGYPIDLCGPLVDFLVEHRRELFKKLDFGEYKESVDYLECQPSLKFYFKGEHKGWCEQDNKIFPILELIRREIEKIGVNDPIAWASQFQTEILNHQALLQKEISDNEIFNQKIKYMAIAGVVGVAAGFFLKKIYDNAEFQFLNKIFQKS